MARDTVPHTTAHRYIDFKIVQQNKVFYETSRSNWQPKGQILFTWNGKYSGNNLAPAGSYELRIKALLEQDNAPPETASIDITFEHNPRWLQ